MSITKQIQTIRDSLDAIGAMLGGGEVVKQNLTTDATIIRKFCDHCGIGTAQDGAGCLNCRALKAIARGAKSPDHQPNSPQIDNAAAAALNRRPDDENELQQVIDNIVRRDRAALERTGLSKAPDAGSLKNDEAWDATRIMEAEINRLRNRRPVTAEAVRKLVWDCFRAHEDRNHLVALNEPLVDELARRIAEACNG